MTLPDIIQLSSWIVFIAALYVVAQNLLYIRRGHKRRQGYHFATMLLAMYLATIYLIAAIDPANFIVRIGLPTKLGIIIQLYLIYKVTVMDEDDYRLDDRLGRRQ